jgi:hypothetical protein
MYFIGTEGVARHPESLISRLPAEAERECYEMTRRSFWEYAEIGYIQLVCFWDRVGQLLDFIFFNIRQYERDGFPAVIDRIAVNYLPLSFGS